MDFFSHCFSEANIVPSILMILVSFYWFLMVIGVVGVDLFDIDVDVDAELGMDADFGMDLDVDGDLASAGADLGSGSATTGGDSFLKNIFEFFYISDIPIVIVGSVFVFGFWVSSIITSRLFNPELTVTGAIYWLIPNLVLALAVMRIMIWPMAALLRRTGTDDTLRKSMHGVIGRVKTSEVTETFGEIEVTEADGNQLVLNVRTAPGEKLGKGDAAKIISYNHHDGTFLVELTKWEQTPNE